MSRNATLDCLLIVTIIGGLLPLGASHWWGFELLSHFRAQYVVLALLLLAVAIRFCRHLLALPLAAATGLNGWPLLPYLPSTAPDLSGRQIDVLNVNVNSNNTNHADIVDAIRAADSDLVSIVELTPALDEALHVFADVYPYRFSAPATGNFGIGILSQYPLIEPASFSTVQTKAIDTIVELPTGPLRFFAVHLLPPKTPTMTRARNLQLDELAEYASGTEDSLLVCGDFNLTPYSPRFDKFVENTELRDVRRGRGLSFTWPTFMPLLGIPIDHCLIRGPMQVESVERMDRIGSDHYPVHVSLRWQDNG